MGPEIKQIENIEFSYQYNYKLINANGKVFDLGVAETLSPKITDATQDINRYKYNGMTGKITTGRTFEATFTATSDLNDEAYSYLESLWGGEIKLTEGHTLIMTWPLRKGQKTAKQAKIPVNISFSGALTGNAQDTTKLEITFNGAGAIEITQATIDGEVLLDINTPLGITPNSGASKEVKFAADVENGFIPPIDGTDYEFEAGVLAQAIIDTVPTLTNQDFTVVMSSVMPLVGVEAPDKAAVEFIIIGAGKYDAKTKAKIYGHVRFAKKTKK